jgi:hypothetical protein
VVTDMAVAVDKIDGARLAETRCSAETRGTSLLMPVR